MKHRLFSAACVAALLPFCVTSSPLSTAAVRPVYQANLATTGTGTGWETGTTPNPGYATAVDSIYETWLYPALTRLIQDISAGRLTSAANSFVSIKATLQSRSNHQQAWGTRYQSAWSQVSTAEDLVRQGYRPAAADMMQVLLNQLRGSAARLQPPTYYPGTYQSPTQTVSSYSAGTQATPAGRSQRGISAYQEILTAMNSGDLQTARALLDRLSQRMQRRGRPQATQLRFMAQNLSPVNLAWAQRQLLYFRNQALALGGAA